MTFVSLGIQLSVYLCKIKSALSQKDALHENLCTTSTYISKLHFSTLLKKPFPDHSQALWAGVASFSSHVFTCPPGLCQVVLGKGHNKQGP